MFLGSLHKCSLNRDFMSKYSKEMLCSSPERFKMTNKRGLLSLAQPTMGMRWCAAWHMASTLSCDTTCTAWMEATTKGVRLMVTRDSRDNVWGRINAPGLAHACRGTMNWLHNQIKNSPRITPEAIEWQLLMYDSHVVVMIHQGETKSVVCPFSPLHTQPPVVPGPVLKPHSPLYLRSSTLLLNVPYTREAKPSTFCIHLEPSTHLFLPVSLFSWASAGRNAECGVRNMGMGRVTLWIHVSSEAYLKVDHHGGCVFTWLWI